MTGSHGFNPKEDSTFLVEESPSFYEKRLIEDSASQFRIQAPNDSNLEESRPLEIPVLQNQVPNQSFLGPDQSNIMAMSTMQPNSDASFVGEV